MRKLIILKSLVDFLWFVACIPVIPLVLFFAVYMFFDNEVLKNFKFFETEINAPNGTIQILMSLAIALVLISIYCFYLFRKTLRYFQRRQPFDDYVINTYKRIGKLLMIFGISGVIISFVFPLFFSSRINISFGISPYVFVICLGLFFAVLSETFKIAKTAKQENDLTI